ncbi:MAG: hypothetical protein ABI782_02035 [Anaerolineaceae bacterium]
MAQRTEAAPPPMLFAFRGVRMFQVLLAIIALACGVGATLALKAVADGEGILLLLPAIILGMVFLWAFSATLRAPTSFLAVTPERTRIRFAGLIDTVISNNDVAGARLVRRNILGGIGVRTNFSGDVALVTTWGEVVELTLRNPVRVWLVPRIIPLRATRLTLSLRNSQKLVDRFGAPTAPSRTVPAGAGGKRRQRGSRTR